MARTIAQIQQSIIDAKNSDSTLSGLTSTSNTAIWLLWTWVVATVIFSLEMLFDSHKSEVQTILDNQKPHTIKWYASKAKLFQFGDVPAPDTDYYVPINTGHQIVAYAACTEISNYLQLKVAKSDSGNLVPLDAIIEVPAFAEYINIIKDAGVRVVIISLDGYKLVITGTIYYNPLMLDSAGERLDSTSNTPVFDAITAYLQSIPFDGIFVFNRMVEAILAVEGVVIANITDAQASAAVATPPYFNCMIKYNSPSGYLILDTANSVLSYVPQSPI